MMTDEERAVSQTPAYTAAEFARIAGGELVWGSYAATFAGAGYDSRVIRPGQLFFAIKGSRVDGHNYLLDAMRRGATCFLVGEWRPEWQDSLAKPSSANSAVIQVPDTVLAMGRFARAHRRAHSPLVIGVTGSVGKTTAKDMAAHILERSRRCLVTEGNLNSDVSLPIVLLELNAQHELAVLEMATRGGGQLTYLAEMAKPHIALITVVAPVHVQTIGSLAAIASAKAELARAIPDDGLVVYNHDSVALRDEFRRWPLKCPTVSYGFDTAADVTAIDAITTFTHCEGQLQAELSFSVICKPGPAAARLSLPTRQALRFSLPYPGRHNALNAIGAALAGAAAGIPFDDGLGRLRSFRARSAMRLDISLHHGLLLIDDAYNANPLSMTAALEILSSAAAGRRKAAILGDMRELGSLEATSHRQLGQEVARTGLDLLICVGRATCEHTAPAAIAAGLPRDAVVCADGNSHAAQMALSWLRPGDALLIKGSRGLTMEEVVEQVRQGWEG